jgi:hypothetical protein
MFLIRQFRSHLSFNSILMNLTADLKPVQSPVNTRPVTKQLHDVISLHRTQRMEPSVADVNCFWIYLQILHQLKRLKMLNEEIY